MAESGDTLAINGSVTSSVTVTNPGALIGGGTITGSVLGNGANDRVDMNAAINGSLVNVTVFGNNGDDTFDVTTGVGTTMTLHSGSPTTVSCSVVPNPGEPRIGPCA